MHRPRRCLCRHSLNPWIRYRCKVLTYYKSDVVPDQYWQELATTNDTPVFYMSAETVEGIVSNRCGMAQEGMAYCGNRAATSYSRCIGKRSRFATSVACPLFHLRQIIGAKFLHEQFAWLPNAPEREQYFK